MNELDTLKTEVLDEMLGYCNSYHSRDYIYACSCAEDAYRLLDRYTDAVLSDYSNSKDSLQ